MLWFFTDPYEDELLYSAFARYHYYSRGYSFQATQQELFGNTAAKPNEIIPTNLDFLCKQLLNRQYTADYFIKKHTTLPYYLLFLQDEKRLKLLNHSTASNGKHLFALPGSNFFKALYYCPVCAKEDTERIGEPYFHRMHQLEGIIICPKHYCVLKGYKPYTNPNRCNFVRLDIRHADFNIEWPMAKVASKLIDLAVLANLSLSIDYDKWPFEDVFGKMQILLNQKGYVKENGFINQNKFTQDLYEFYGEEILRLVEGIFDTEKQHEWPRRIARSPDDGIVHPIRYILIIRFLSGTVEQAMKYLQFKDDESPAVKVHKRTMAMDEEWQAKLCSLASNGKSYKQIALSMGCAKNTAKKYVLLLYKNQGATDNISNEVDYSDCEESKKAISEYIDKNPQATKVDIRKVLFRFYNCLYKYDKASLDRLIAHAKPNPYNSAIQKVDWAERDEWCLNKLQEAYRTLKSKEPPTKLCKYPLLDAIGYNSVYFYLDRLPKTKEALDVMCETTNQFRLRRIEYLGRKMLVETGEIRKWRLLQKAGVDIQSLGKESDQVDKIILNLYANDKRINIPGLN